MAEANVTASYPSLRGRVVVISGGASGIGEGLVEAFTRQGSTVVFLDVADDAAHALIARLADAGLAAPRYYACDLADVSRLRAVALQIEAEYGPVDVLINNAGNDTRHRVEETTPELWDALMAVNLRQQFFLTQALLPGMRQRQSGSVINLSSISWVIPSTGLPAYVTAKAAIVGMTRTLAHEVGADNVRVNAVLPGAIATERQRRLWLTPQYTAEVMSRQALKRELLPADVAATVLFLASDDSSAITSQSLVVDGGWV